MDILDKHDLEQLLRDPDLRVYKTGALDPLIDRLERFFYQEIPARERDRDAARRVSLGIARREFPATVHVLSPNRTERDEAIIDMINQALDAYPIRVSAPTLRATIERVQHGPSSTEIDSNQPRKPSAGKAKKTSAKRRATPRIAALTAVFLTACATPGDAIVADDQVDDAGAELDGGIDADPDRPDADPGVHDAGAGLPQGSACDPLAAECAGGLTCRITSLDPEGGTCRTVGAALENDPCNLDNGDDDCGAAMACLGTSDTRCYVICDLADPEPRCGVADTCVQAWGATVDLGACSP